MSFLKIFKISLLITFILSSSGVLAQTSAREMPDDAYEGIFQLRYHKFKPQFMPAMVYEDSVYLPFTQTISLLKIFYNYQPAERKISGFFIEKDTLFNIDFNTGIGKIGMVKDIKLNRDDYFVSDFEVYVLPGVMKEVFDIDVKIFFDRLDIILESDKELPVLLEEKRKQEYAFLGLDSSGYAPLLYDRDKAVLNGAIIDYNLGANMDNRNQRTYNWSFNTGTEVLGGALQFMYGGNHFENTGITNGFTSYNWTYHFDWAPWLTQLSAGYVSNISYRASQVPTRSLKGVMLTNEKYRASNSFMDYIIEDRTQPDWQVELWIDHELHDQVIADPLGNYKFNVPIKYGNTYVETRFYGLDGQYEYYAEEFQIPSQFLKPGELKYTLSGGKALNYINTSLDTNDLAFDPYIGEAKLAIGITNWMTTEAKVGKIEGTNDVDIYSHTDFRLMEGDLIPSIDWAPDKMIKTQIKFRNDYIGFFNGFYSRYFGTNDLNTDGKDHQIVLYGGLPRFDFINSRLTFSGQRVYYSTDDVTTDADVKMRSRFDPFDLDLRYKMKHYHAANELIGDIFTQSLSASIYYSWRDRDKLLDILGPTRFRLTAGYNLSSNEFGGGSFLINQRLKELGTLEFKIVHTIAPKATHFGLSLLLDFDVFRSRSSAYFADEGNSYSQNFSGVVGIDTDKFKVYMNNPSEGATVGRGAAAMRFYLDNNANNEFDDDEEALPGIRVDMSNSARFIGDENGIIKRAYNLYPYTRYNVTVDLESFQNPLWIPTRTNFSFVADPNSYKPIDVPCYSAGVVEGSVMFNNGKNISPQARVMVHIVSADSSIQFDQTVPVFSDGSFYLMGVPPGEYYAYIDSTQTDVLSAESLPFKKKIVVRKTTDGDFVSNIDFELVPAKFKHYIVDGKLKLPESGATGESSVSTSLPKENDSFDPGESSIETGSQREKALIVPNNIERFFFEGPQSVNLTDEMTKYLDGVAEYLLENPRAILKVIGYSDDLNDYEAAQTISLERADKVCQYLIDAGISRDRLFPTGKGDRDPIDYQPDENGVNRGKNRRIEIQIVD